MLKSLRFTFDHEELVSVFSSKGTAAISHMRIASLIYLCAACCWLIAQETAMQVFQCHYREGSLMSGLYFDHIKDVLHAASQGTSGFSCKPPPCLNLQNSPGTLFILNLCISDGRPERVKQLSGLLVVQVLIWIWGPRGETGIRYARVNAQQTRGDERSCVIKRCIRSGFKQGTLGISKREQLIES